MVAVTDAIETVKGWLKTAGSLAAEHGVAGLIALLLLLLLFRK
jgi:hypothetical protein